MGKQSRQKQARREVDAELATIPALRAAALSAIETAGLPVTYPPVMVAAAELMARAAYEQTLAAGLSLTTTSTAHEWADFSAKGTEIFDRYAQLANWLQEVSFDATMDCKPGCSWCCHLRVTITAEEGFRLAQAIDDLEPSTRERVRGRLASHVEETNGMGTTDILRKPRLCPLNENAQCLVYEARPVVCRAAHSYNVRACRGYVETGTSIPSRKSALIQEIGRFVAVALRQTRERLGFETRAFELSDLVASLDAGQMPSSEALDAVYRPEVEAAALLDARRAQAGFA